MITGYTSPHVRRDLHPQRERGGGKPGPGMSVVVLPWIETKRKGMYLHAASRRNEKLADWVLKVCDAACQEQRGMCAKCGSDMETVHPVSGEDYEVCLVCRLRDDLAIAHGTIERLEAQNEIDIAGKI